MIPLAGQTARPNGLKFFLLTLMGSLWVTKAKKNLFSNFFYGQRLALKLVFIIKQDMFI